MLIADWKDLHDKLKEQFEELKSLYNEKVEIIDFLLEERESGETIINSDYWRQFEQKTRQAMAEYPDWSKDQKKIQKTGNLQDWLMGEIGLDSREAEIIKQILSDVFENLR